jgi:hypothetical protein
LSLGYPSVLATLDTIPYACACCEVPLRFNKSRKFPDELCLRCYTTFKDQKQEPWMQELFRRERARRMRLYRGRAAGIDYETVSYEEAMHPATPSDPYMDDDEIDTDTDGYRHAGDPDDDGDGDDGE